MNEQTTTQLVRKAYQSFETGNIQFLLDLLAEDVLWELPEMANVPFAGVWHGRQQVQAFFMKMGEVQDVIEFRTNDFIAQGDKVVVEGYFSMRVKATGKTSRAAWVHVWRFENGSVRQVREYVDSLAVNQAHTK